MGKPIVFQGVISRRWFVLGPDVNVSGPYLSWREALSIALDMAVITNAVEETLGDCHA